MCLNIHTQPLQLGVNVVNPTCVRCPQRMRRALNHFVFSLQVLTILQEVFPAVKAAEMAVKFRPLWWEGWQTLGRAQLNLGEVDLVSRAADALRRKKTKRSQVAERPLQQMRALVCSGGAGGGALHHHAVTILWPLSGRSPSSQGAPVSSGNVLGTPLFAADHKSAGLSVISVYSRRCCDLPQNTPGHAVRETRKISVTVSAHSGPSKHSVRLSLSERET